MQFLQVHRPDLMTRKGIHFASMLGTVYEAQLAKLTAESSTQPADSGPRGKNENSGSAQTEKAFCYFSVMAISGLRVPARSRSRWSSTQPS